MNGSLVEDLLQFDVDARSFSQNLTAFPFQDCVQNWVLWTGTYLLASPTDLERSYTRCTPSSFGCVVCGPTKVDWAVVAFSDTCDRLSLEVLDQTLVYYEA